MEKVFICFCEFFEKKNALVDESIPPERKTPTSTSDMPLYLIDSSKVLAITLLIFFMSVNYLSFNGSQYLFFSLFPFSSKLSQVPASSLFIALNIVFGAGVHRKVK